MVIKYMQKNKTILNNMLAFNKIYKNFLTINHNVSKCNFQSNNFIFIK